jgi:hypothetical protein
MMVGRCGEGDQATTGSEWTGGRRSNSLPGRTMAELHQDTNDRHSCAAQRREARGLERVLVPQVSTGARTRPVTLEHFRNSDDQ